MFFLADYKQQVNKNMKFSISIENNHPSIGCSGFLSFTVHIQVASFADWWFMIEWNSFKFFTDEKKRKEMSFDFKMTKNPLIPSFKVIPNTIFSSFEQLAFPFFSCYQHGTLFSFFSLLRSFFSLLISLIYTIIPWRE